MEERSKRAGSKDSGQGDADSSSLVDSIRAVAAANARAPLNSEKQILLFLQSWWSRTYNRPLKDPLLLSYSLEELLYEFYDRIERQKAQTEQTEQEDDKIEENKEQEALDWAEQEEKRELEAMRQQGEESLDPTKDPQNIAWMEQEMQKAKDIFGETFGEDIEESFE
jgi:hypothetical protein